MHPTIVPSSGPKLKLVEAAERLFAERGFDVVSVRDITHAAGGNVAAVNYHFGSRDGLVAVVIGRSITPINERRMVMLDELEQKWAGQPVPVEAVIEVIVVPVVEQIEQSKMAEGLYCKLVGRIFGMHGSLPDKIEAQFVVLLDRLKRALRVTLRDISGEELVWRLHFVVGGMLHMLTHRESLERISQGAAGTPDMATTVGRFLRFAAAGLLEGTAVSKSGPTPQALPPVSTPTAPEVVEEPRQEEPAPILAPPVLENPPVLEEPPVLENPPALEEPPVPEELPAPDELAVPEELPVPEEPVVLEEPAMADESPKPGPVVKKRTKKTEAESPQVFFDF